MATMVIKTSRYKPQNSELSSITHFRDNLYRLVVLLCLTLPGQTTLAEDTVTPRIAVEEVIVDAKWFENY